MTDQQHRFIDEYLIDCNGTHAAIRAGYAKHSAQAVSSRLLSNAKVADELARRQKKLSEDAQITQKMVLERYWAIATANPNELTQYRRDNCRHCWGEGHAYQWTLPEYEAACEKAAADDVAAPPCIGGTDFDFTRPPHPDCPECKGEGRGAMHVADTRKLSDGALALYAGVKVGKDGLEIKVHDQLAALNAVGRHLGFFNDKLEVAVGEFDTAKLADTFGEAMAKSRKMTEAMRKDRAGGDD